MSAGEMTRGRCLAAALAALLLAGCSLIENTNADRDIKSMEQAAADLKKPAGGPAPNPVSTTIGLFPGMPTIPTIPTIPTSTTAPESGAGGQESPRPGSPGGTEVTVPVATLPVAIPPIPPPTSSTTIYVPRLPSVFPRASMFCEAGSNFVRVANTLFTTGPIPATEMAQQVQTYLKFLDETIALAPPELTARMEPVRQLRDEFRAAFAQLETPQDFRTFATFLFQSRPDAVASADFFTEWCGAQPTPRRDPQP